MSSEFEETLRQQGIREDRDRQDSVDIISSLYPPDSEYPDTSVLGREDLIAALCTEWRSLPVPVLKHMAKLQHFRDHKL